MVARSNVGGISGSVVRQAGRRGAWKSALGSSRCHAPSFLLLLLSSTGTASNCTLGKIHRATPDVRGVREVPKKTAQRVIANPLCRNGIQVLLSRSAFGLFCVCRLFGGAFELRSTLEQRSRTGTDAALEFGTTGTCAGHDFFVDREIVICPFNAFP